MIRLWVYLGVGPAGRAERLVARRKRERKQSKVEDDYIHSLWLLFTAPNLAAKNNRKVLSHGSGGQKSAIKESLTAEALGTFYCSPLPAPGGPRHPPPLPPSSCVCGISSFVSLRTLVIGFGAHADIPG